MTSRITITTGASRKPAAGRALAECLQNQDQFSGDMMIGYPIIGTPEGRHSIDAILLSPELGVVVFDLIEGSTIEGYRDRQDDSANKIEARLKSHRELVERRQLKIPIYTISFAPGVGDAALPKAEDEQYLFTNSSNLIPSMVNCLNWPSSEEGTYRTALSAIQNISTIRKNEHRRDSHRPDSRGSKLRRLEDSIATLDERQSRAVIETSDGVQRIRGLAGSGKTIVLALKAAYLHAQFPAWRIAVTFNTRSLKGVFRNLINKFSLSQTGEEPDWKRLRIINAWGAPGGPHRSGVYYEFCKENNVEYLDFQDARKRFGSGNEFSGACQIATDLAPESNELYDAILVDEAQDLPPQFLQLCYRMLSGKKKKLIYAYDELQDLREESMPAPEVLFGKGEDGRPRVELVNHVNRPNQDIILEKCYRNSRPVLVTAHSLGFGIYREPKKNQTTGLVQMFEHPNLWREIGYKVKSGTLAADQSVVLYRDGETSPRFLEEHSELDDLVEFHRFPDEKKQAEWLAEAIARDLEENELLHEDIVVIHTEPLRTRSKLGPARKLLLDRGIRSHLAGVDTSADVFFQTEEPSITFTGIFRAKGNEAGMVYIVDAQDCHSSSENLARNRNRLFTAISRSKAWVRVLGIGPGMKALEREFQELERRDFELRFRYPTPPELERMKTVHRDMSHQDKALRDQSNRKMKDVIRDLELGHILLEDLDEELKNRMKSILSQGEDHV